MWRYDPVSNHLTLGSPFPGTQVCYPAGFSIDGKVYIGLGGIFRNGCTLTTSSAFWEYTPAASAPTQTPEDGATPTLGEKHSEPRQKDAHAETTDVPKKPKHPSNELPKNVPPKLTEPGKPAPNAANQTDISRGVGKGINVDLSKGVKLEMVLIPAGEFLMGSPDSDKGASSDFKPQHQARITKSFYLGKYPVTQEQWEAVMGNNPSHFKGPKNPVEDVSWEDCQQFLRKLNAKAGGDKFQLPTEAQWEYACRAGSKTKYCFGDDETQLGEYAWYGKNSGNTTHPVGEKKPNAWGLYDMHGNVWQWCADWWGWYDARSITDDPTGPPTGLCRVFRGGGWGYDAEHCWSASRGNGAGPDSRRNGLGLRVSLVPAEK